MINNSIISLMAIGYLGIFNLTAKEKTPNVVLILMDDLGYGDLSCYGALQYCTPNLDQMANQGIRFTNYLSPQAVCSASRAGLMTGCYPNRVGISLALFPDSKIGLNPDEITIAELFKQKGYSTAIFGKWHLGDKREFLPLQQGFDEYFGLPYSNDMWPHDYLGKDPEPKTFQYNCMPLPLINGNEKVGVINTMDDQAKLTRLYTEQAIQFIKKNKNKPFFMYLAHSMPHVPLAASEKFRGKSNAGLYGDVMLEMDWSVGEVLKTLSKEGIESNTLIIFTSDNGPWRSFGNHAGSSGGFREAKTTVFEGGQRVPCLMKWPGKIPKGLVCNKLSSSIDILPTLASICHLDLPKNKIDGVNISDLLIGKAEISPRRYFYYYYDKNSLKAVRRDDWKLVLPHKSTTYEKNLPGMDGHRGEISFITEPLALYDLRQDPSERYDVQISYPEIVEELKKVAEEARKDLGDDLTERKGNYRREPGKVE